MPDSTRNAVNQHAVRFYDNDRSLAVIVANFLHEGLVAGHPGIVIATLAQLAAIIQELNLRSLDVAELQRSKSLLLLDSSDMLREFMTDRGPDAEKFTVRMSEVIDTVCDGRVGCTVRIFGQMVDVLCQQGKHDDAISLEMLWNQLGQTKSYSLLCGYAMGHFYKGAKFDEVCAQHTSVLTVDMHPSSPGAAGWRILLTDSN
jgi:hypothetical protein